MADEEQAAGDPLWVARQNVSLDELATAEGALWWLQGWPQDGTTRLMRQAGRGAPAPVTPRGFSVGGWLHRYGCSSYAVRHLREGVVRRRSAKEWFGVAPTGETIEYAEHSFHEVRDGRFCKMNHLIDAQAVQRRLGT
jgi:hypothetical protein